MHLTARPLLLAALALLLAACGSSAPKPAAFEPESFSSTDMHTRSFRATEAQTCEAARRALLSQGYTITAANAELVTGRKSFQPTPEAHVEVEFRTTCLRDAGKGKDHTIAFVTALQDRYGLKKAASSASVGVGGIGSLSLPFASSDDAMVKIASETLNDRLFYDRFFTLLDRYLQGEAAPADAAPRSKAQPVSTFPVTMPRAEATPAPSTDTDANAGAKADTKADAK